MKAKWLAFACVGIALAGGLALWLKKRSGGPIAAPAAPACLGDKACATGRAATLQKLARDESSYLLYDALALQAAYSRDDCDAATEVAGGIERYELDRAKKPALAKAIDDALMGRLGYCAVAAKSNPPPPAPDAWITLSREACYGECPIYDLTVRADGLVSWEGKGFVAKMGSATRRIDPAKARSLFDAFVRMSFEKGPPVYDSGISDTPTATLTISHGAAGGTYAVHDDASCFGKKSIDLGTCYLERRVDEIAEAMPWIEAPRER